MCYSFIFFHNKLWNKFNYIVYVLVHYSGGFNMYCPRQQEIIKDSDFLFKVFYCKNSSRFFLKLLFLVFGLIIWIIFLNDFFFFGFQVGEIFFFQTEQMFTLLAMCLVLHPQRIDEAVQSTLREKPLADKITRMSVNT